MKTVRACLMVLALGMATGVSAQGIQGGTSFDPGRFGEEPTNYGTTSTNIYTPAELNAIRSGASITGANSGLNIYTPQNIQAIQNQRAAEVARKLANQPHQYTQQELENFAKDVADARAVDGTPTAATDANVDAAANELCAMGKTEASALSESDSEAKEFLSNNGNLSDPSQSCIDATKAVFKACSEGNKSGVKDAGKKALGVCEVEKSEINPGDKEPQSVHSYNTPSSPAETLADRLTNATQQAGKVNLMDPSTLRGMFNSFLLASLQQQIASMMNGGSGNGNASEQPADVPYTPETPATEAVCDKVAEKLNEATPVVVTASGITTTTNVTTNLCENGNIQQVRIVAVDNGTNVTRTTTTTVTKP